MGSLALLTAFAVSGGCLDDSAVARNEATRKFQTTIAAAEKAMASVNPRDPQENRASAESLRQLAASATPAFGSTPSQKSALALVASQLLMQAARLDSVAIEGVEQSIRSNADKTLVYCSLSLQFESLSKNTSLQVPAEAREALEKEKTTNQMVLNALNDQIQKQQEAVDQTASAIERNSGQALELEKQANDLKQQAIASGPIDGLKFSVESQAALTNSRKLQSQSANLDLDSQSTALEKRIALLTARAYADSLKRNETSMGAISEIESLREASIVEFTRLADQYRAWALESAKELRASRENLNALYDGAIECLEKAVSLAQQGASGESSKTAKYPLVSAQLALAGLLERRESSSGLQISAFTSAATIDPDGAWGKDASAAQAVRRGAREKAIEVFEAVLNGVPEGSSDESVAKFRKSIEVASAALTSGKPKQDATSEQPQTQDGAPSEQANPDASKSAEPSADAPAGETPTETPAETPADAPAEPPADPAATDPTNAPPADPPASDPPADPAATDPTNAPPADPPASDPPASDPPASDPPASDPPASDPPANEPPSSF